MTHSEDDSDPGWGSVNVERLEHLEQRPSCLIGRITENDDVEEVLPDGPEHARKCRSQQLSHRVRPALVSLVRLHVVDPVDRRVPGR